MGAGVRVGAGVAVTVGVGVGVATGPRSTTCCTGAASGGSAMSLTEVPAGTSTVSSTVSPLVSVTASRCSSAEAGTTTAA